VVDVYFIGPLQHFVYNEPFFSNKWEVYVVQMVFIFRATRNGNVNMYSIHFAPIRLCFVYDGGHAIMLAFYLSYMDFLKDQTGYLIYTFV
jgi:hypothetical protein